MSNTPKTDRLEAEMAELGIEPNAVAETMMLEVCRSLESKLEAVRAFVAPLDDDSGVAANVRLLLGDPA